MLERVRLGGALVLMIAGAACSDAPSENAPGGPADPGPPGGGDTATTDGGATNPGGGCTSTIAARPGTVITQSGAVRGVASNGTWAWKGIPYVAPPIGAQRFRPPQPAACWTDEKQTIAYGPKCPQVDRETKQFGGDEDCLTLNVWAKEGASGAPVMVFIHGGGNTGGSASEPFYDGIELAARTGAVVVTIQYRLGALGFLATEGLKTESANGVAGNYGILDQIEALKWVKTNIAGFGGKPDNVFIFGESAGAQNTLVHIASPLSKGLFRAAAVESGGVYRTTLAEAITQMKELVDAVGCGTATDVTACLRGKGAEEIAKVPSADGPLARGLLRYGPVIDGWVLKDNARNVIASGQHNHVPVIIGTNADETSRMVPAVKTDAEYVAAVKSLYPSPPGAADKILSQYPSSAYPSPHKALIALTTDATWTCPTRTLARALAANQTEPVYRYLFSWRSPGPAGQVVGATHGLELPFVFRTFGTFGNGGFTPSAADLALSEAMQGYWSRVASTGDANGGGTTWPRYEVSSDPYLELNTTIASKAALAKANCDFIDSLTP